MGHNKFVTVLFYIFPLYLGLHLVYGLIVREPYPSLMMPGFSRIDNDGETYQLLNRKIAIITESLDTLEYDLSILETSVSKVALSRMIDLALFKKTATRIENSSQKKYYGIIKLIIGEENYQKHILDVRYPPLQRESIRQFEKWTLNKVQSHMDFNIFRVTIQRIQETRDFTSGRVLNKEVVDEIELKDD